MVDISYINYPDSAGTACDVQQHALHIPTFNSNTIPNHPDYFMGEEPGSICDSLTTTISELTPVMPTLNISPTPASTMVTVNAMDIISPVCTLMLFGSTGNKIMERTVNTNAGYMSIDIALGNLPPGMYFINLFDGSSKLNCKFIKR